MKERRIPAIERLEARETPDVALGTAAAAAMAPAPADAAAVDIDADRLLQPLANPLDGDLLANAPVDLESLLAQTGDAAKGTLSHHAVKSLFASTDEFNWLLADSAELLVDSRPLAPTLPSSEPDGWQFLNNYARKAIRRAEASFGTLPDHEDLVHDIFVEWRQQVGPGDQPFSELLQQNSAERALLRKSVRRVIDHARYEKVRGRRTVELFDQPAAEAPGERDWLDLQIDWTLGVDKPAARDRQLLELRRQGFTFEEIGSELGMLKQRVCEAYNLTLRRLQAVYADEPQ
jgi:hypothetical protein